MDELGRLKELLEAYYDEKISMGKMVDLVVDVVNGNLDINTILLHYSMIKDTILADGRTTRHKKV